MNEGLTSISTPDLERLLAAVKSARVSLPLTATAVQSVGLGSIADWMERLAGLDAAGLCLLLEAILAERQQDSASIELVWTGPESKRSASRDTAVVVRELFRSAEKSVLVAGYSFDHGQSILAPLHEAMRDRGVEARIVLDIQGPASKGADVDEFAKRAVESFLHENWRFGEPTPSILWDPRTLNHGFYASMHAKCVVVDDRKTLVTSANFTDRGQDRNIELGVLIEDRSFARRVLGQWNSLELREG